MNKVNLKTIDIIKIISILIIGLTNAITLGLIFFQVIRNTAAAYGVIALTVIATISALIIFFVSKKQIEA